LWYVYCRLRNLCKSSEELGLGLGSLSLQRRVAATTSRARQSRCIRSITLSKGQVADLQNILRFTDVWQILESALILTTCENLEILFLPLRWRYFLITIPSCIYGNVHQRAQSWPVGPLRFKNSCMLILIFFTRVYYNIILRLSTCNSDLQLTRFFLGISYDTIRYETRCYFHLQSKADMSKLLTYEY